MHTLFMRSENTCFIFSIELGSFEGLQQCWKEGRDLCYGLYVVEPQHLKVEEQLHLFRTGSRNLLSTRDSLALLHNDIVGNEASGKPCTMGAIDIERAFNSILCTVVARGVQNRRLYERTLRFLDASL